MSYDQYRMQLGYVGGGLHIVQAARIDARHGLMSRLGMWILIVMCIFRVYLSYQEDIEAVCRLESITTL